jgi:hypothetical protein
MYPPLALATMYLYCKSVFKADELLPVDANQCNTSGYRSQYQL